MIDAEPKPTGISRRELLERGLVLLVTPFLPSCMESRKRRRPYPTYNNDPVPTRVPRSVEANTYQTLEILQAARTLINPGYFSGEIKLRDDKAYYTAQDREVRATALSAGEPTEHFEVGNRYDDSKLVSHSVRIGIKTNILFNQIPGQPLGEKPEEAIETIEGLRVLSHGILNLPFMRWAFTPSIYRSREIMVASGEGIDDLGRLYVVNTHTGIDTTLSLGMYPSGQMPK